MKAYMVIRFVYLIEIVVLLFLYFTLPHTYNLVFLRMLLLGVIINILFFIYFSGKQNRRKHLFLISYLFLLSYCIVFFQKYADLSIGLISESDEIFGFSQSIIHCCIISFVGLLAYAIGFFRHEDKIKISNKTVNKYIIQTKPLKILLIISTVLYFYYNFQNIYIRRSQELLEAQAGTMVLYSQMLYLIMIKLFIAYKVYLLKDKVIKITFHNFISEIGPVCNCCLIIGSILTLLIGGRYNVVSTLLFYFGGFMLCSKRVISKITLIMLLIISVLGLAILGKSRKLDEQLSFSEKLITSHSMIKETYSISPFTAELASSVKTLQYSEYYVPAYHPYFYGYFQLRQIFSSIPFFNHVVYLFTDSSQKKYISSAFFVTWLIQGDNYTYGEGSSCNADLYLNFGIWGVFVGLLIWGIVVRKAENIWANGPTTTIQIICILTLFSQTIFVCRDSLLCFVNMLVFTLIFDTLYRRCFAIGKG